MKLICYYVSKSLTYKLFLHIPKVCKYKYKYNTIKNILYTYSIYYYILN